MMGIGARVPARRRDHQPHSEGRAAARLRIIGRQWADRSPRRGKADAEPRTLQWPAE
jgi:hypothetical protein